MRKSPWRVGWIAAAVVALSASAPGAEIPRGEHLLLRMVNSVTTRTARAGDYVYLRTASPVSVDGRILVPVNSYVQGVVSHVRRAGRIKGRAGLAIRLETLTLPGGRVLAFEPLLDSADSGASGQRVDKGENVIRQGSGRGRDARTIAILAGTGAAVGGARSGGWKAAGAGAGIGAGVGLATVLLTRGRDVRLRPGSTLDVVFDHPVSLEPSPARRHAPHRRPALGNR